MMSTSPPKYNEAGGYPPAQPPYPTVQPGAYPPPQQQPVHPVQPGYVPQPGAYPPQVGFAPQQPGYPEPGYPAQPPYQQQAPKTDYEPVATNDGATHVDIQDALPYEGDAFAGDSFSDKAIRRRFVRKVYMILMCQLAVTVAAIVFFRFHEPSREYIQGSGSWLYFAAYAVFLVTYLTLVCCKSVRRSWPINFICLAVFTVAFSFMAAMISSYHKTEIVLVSMGITAVVCIAITIFAMQTKIDFTMCSGLMFALLMVLILFGFTCMIFSLTGNGSRILYAVYGGLGALVFSLFLIYDTQQLMGGRKYELSPEEHIYGALQIYLDIVYIFLFLMSLFGNSSS